MSTKRIAPRPREDRRSSIDDVIDVYKQSIDRTLLLENLKLTPEERVRNLQRLQRLAEEAARAGKALRKRHA